jgi:NTE family protein
VERSVRRAHDLGADIVIAVDVSSTVAPFDKKFGLDVVLRADAVTRIYLNDILVTEADVVIRPAVGKTHWADFSNPRDLFRQGEIAALAKLVEIRTAIHRVTSPPAPQPTIVDHIKSIKDIIVDKVVGAKP